MSPLEMKQNVVNKELDEKKFNQVKATEGLRGHETLLVSVNISVGRIRPRFYHLQYNIFHEMAITNI